MFFSICLDGFLSKMASEDHPKVTQLVGMGAYFNLLRQKDSKNGFITFAAPINTCSTMVFKEQVNDLVQRRDALRRHL